MRTLLAALLCLAALPARAWESMDDLSSSTNWLPLTQTMRDHSVMNLFTNTEPWGGASWWMSHLSRTNTLPTIDPVWWDPDGSTTNGGWMRGSLYNEAGTAATYSRVWDFSQGIAREPYTSWYIYEAQHWVTNWFASGRAVAAGTETNWNADTLTGGSNLTVQAALEMIGMTNGIRRTYEMTNALTVSGSLDPAATGLYEFVDGAYVRADGCTITDHEGYWLLEYTIVSEPHPAWSNASASADGVYTALTNTIAVGTAYAQRPEIYAFTNGWTRSMDYTGLWLKEDFVSLLSVLRSGWYVPDVSASDYLWQDYRQAFVDDDNKPVGSESIPLYLRSGVYHRAAYWSTNYLMGVYDTRIDLVVTNTLLPGCDGAYLAGYLSDYGRLDGIAEITGIEKEAPGQNWAIYPDEGYVIVSNAPAPFVSANGSYTAAGICFTNVPYDRNSWRISDFDGQFVLWDRNANALEYLYLATGAVSPDVSGYYDPVTYEREMGGWVVDTSSGNAELISTTALITAVDYGSGVDPLNPDVSGNYSPNGSRYNAGGYDMFYDSAESVWCIGPTNASSVTNAYFSLLSSAAETDVPLGVWSSGWLGTLPATGDVFTARIEWQQTGTNLVGAYAPQYTGIWGYTGAVGTVYIAREPNGFVATNLLWGQYLGYNDYAGATCDVGVAYFYRAGTVTGEYVNIGTATSAGIAEVIEGPGWMNLVGIGDVSELNAMYYVAANYTAIAADNLAAMADFSPPVLTMYSGKGSHRRGVEVWAYETLDVPAEPTPTNVFKRIWLGISENDIQESPACIVDHHFGDGSEITASRGLPAITNVNLFNETGYYTNSFGLSYVHGAAFPYISFDLIDFPTNRTYFQYIYEGITTNNFQDYSYVNAVTNIDFIGWVMEFDFD